MSKNNISIAVVTRLQLCETPYLNEFLEYYTLLGVDKFYLINTEPENRDLIYSEISAEFYNSLLLIDKNIKDTLRTCANSVLHKIQEIFLLYIDMDEFLYLNGITLKEFILKEGLAKDKERYTECKFDWVMSPLCKPLYSPSIEEILKIKYFFPARMGKSLTRTENVVQLLPHHSKFYGKKKIKRYRHDTNNCFVFHVSSRGILDIINKVHFGQYVNVKRSLNPKNELMDLIYNKDSIFLPGRFMLLSFQSQFHPYIVNINYKYPDLKHKPNVKLLKELTLSSLCGLLEREVSEADLEKNILTKLNRFSIPKQLIEQYINNDLTFLQALEELSKHTVAEVQHNT